MHTSVNYPNFTDPADHTEILQVSTHAHTCEISTSSYLSHPVKMYISHTSRSLSRTHLSNTTDPADHTDHTDPANPPINMDIANPFINMGKSCGSCRPHPGQDEQIIQITQISLRYIIQILLTTHIWITQIKSPLRYTRGKYLPHTDPIPAKHDVNKCEISRFYNSCRSYQVQNSRKFPLR